MDDELVDDVVGLSIQGVPVYTRRATLCVVADSSLAARFAEGGTGYEEERDEDGNICMDDCSPNVFLAIVEWLRLRRLTRDLLLDDPMPRYERGYGMRGGDEGRSLGRGVAPWVGQWGLQLG